LGGADRNRVRTAAIARQIDEGLFDVTQWSSLAAADGDRYQVEHGGSGRLYSTCQEFEAVSGTISSRNGGQFDVDMPPVSTRTLLHRARITGPELRVTVEQLITGDFELESLALRCGESFPRGVRQAYACYRDQIYELKATDAGFVLQRPGTPVVRFLNQFDEDMLTRPWAGGMWGAGGALDDDEDLDTQIIFKRMARVLVGNSFGISDEMSPDELKLGEHIVRAFFYAPLTPEFRVQGSDFDDQQGFVLYVVDLPVNPIERGP
jgi:hypothetical protein